MHVVILGAGVIGVCSAWYLSRAGLDVTVIDKLPDIATGTSFANAGQLSTGYAAPWAAPGVPIKAFKWLFQSYGPFKITPDALVDLDLYKWLLSTFKQCNSIAYHENKSKMVELARYSQHCMKEILKQTQFDFDYANKGTLQLFRHTSQMTASENDSRILSDLGVQHQLLDTELCLVHEPALTLVREKFVGGLHIPTDETGDCYRFTSALANVCRDRGVKFVMNCEIQKISIDQNRIKEIKTTQGNLSADAVLVSLGVHSKNLVRKLKIDLPIYPVKGYSMTVTADSGNAPKSTIMDETYKVALTRLGDRIRVGGIAELSGLNNTIPQKRKHNLSFVLKDLFPGVTNLNQARYWTGLRPMTPNGIPLIGKSRISNLFFNTGHGTLGWTMAAGSGRLVSDIISETKTEISPIPYAVTY